MEQAFRMALERHQRGELDGARSMYRQLLIYDPDHSDTLNLLGVVHAQVGDYTEAARLIRRAIELHPGVASYWNNLGNALKDAGQTEEAVASYQKASTLPGGSLEAFGNLGNLFRELGQFKDSVTAFENALANQPPQDVRLRLYNDMGAALGKAGRLDEAVAAFQKILDADPNYPQAQQNMGVVLVQMGRLEEGMAACAKAVTLKDDLFEAHMNLGIALGKQGRFDEAAARCRRALELQPGNPKVHVNLIHVYSKQCRMDQALQACDLLLNSLPNHSLSHEARAGVLQEVGRLDEAIVSATRAIELDPVGSMSAHSGRIFTRQFHLGSDARSQAADQRGWDRSFAIDKRPPTLTFIKNRDPHRRLRVGYVSPNFNNHCQAFFMMPLLKNHDKTQVEVFCYSDVSVPHLLTDTIRTLADQWRPITGLPHDVVADKIREDRIDILVDLTMHMSDTRLMTFARKPAPIQVTWLAYPGSTGLSAIDYRLTDPYLDPPGLFDELYVERSIRLPDTFWVYDPLEQIDVAPLPFNQTGQVTFGCLNNFCKINSEVLRLWARIMDSTKNSRLILLSPMGRHREAVDRVMADAGISADRIEHVDRKPRRLYLELYNRIDVCLDTFPYNGHTTSLDAYYMGVPVVTLVGKTVVGRAGLSQMTNLGLTDLVTYSEEQYVQVATDLAAAPERMAELRSTMRERMEKSPLMDGPRFARNMEAAYRKMWHTWCATV